jgi:phospholipid/cholesterol/gamma-HCH transport system substrate-binding protein
VLFQKVKSIHELADSFNKRSGTIMEEARHTLADLSEAANGMTRKLNPEAVVPAPPRRGPRRP